MVQTQESDRQVGPRAQQVGPTAGSTVPATLEETQAELVAAGVPHQVTEEDQRDRR